MASPAQVASTAARSYLNASSHETSPDTIPDTDPETSSNTGPELVLNPVPNPIPKPVPKGEPPKSDGRCNWGVKMGPRGPFFRPSSDRIPSALDLKCIFRHSRG